MVSSLPASLQCAEAGLLPGGEALPAGRVLRGVERVAGVTRVSGGGQRRAVAQLGLRGVHDGHHPVPGGDELVLHKVLVGKTKETFLVFCVF